MLLDDFSGGINLRDAPSQLQANESPDTMNITLDERGALQKRLGYRNDNTISGINGQIPSMVYYSTTLEQIVIQCGAELYRRTGVGTYTEMVRAGPANAFTTSAIAQFADFNGILYIVHPADGILRWDGVNIVVVTAAVKGVAIAVWQNKIWAGGPWSDGTNKSRVWWSNAGNGNTWTTATDFVDIRDLNDEAITALGNGQTVDQAGAGSPERSSGLLVYKSHSMYRLSDSATGEYATLSGDGGAANPRAVCSLAGIIASVNDRGVWITNGLDPPVRASDKLSPIFTNEAISFTGLDAFSAGCYRDRMFFSLRMTGDATNELTIEYSPTQGWMTLHSFGMNAWAVHMEEGAIPYAVRDDASRLYRMFVGGMDAADQAGDEGDSITFHYQTAWLQPAQHYTCRFRRVRISGINAGSPGSSAELMIRHDYNTIDAHQHDLDLTSGTRINWEDGHDWNEGNLWGPTGYEVFQDHFSHGWGKAIQFHLEGVSWASSTSPPIYRDGPSHEIGDFIVRSIQLDFVRLAPS